MTKKTTKTKNAAKLPKTDQKLTFLEHFKELKRRLTIVAVSIFAFGTGAYFVQHQIVNFLLAPAEGQKLIYTSPGGGLDFLFRVCIYTGIICSLPIIIFNVLRYLEPVMKNGSVRFAGIASITSAVLAIAGMSVGYFLGLPATLHFLFHQFSPTSEISPLIAVQSYMGFVSLYMFGAALIFQIPLVLIFINRIKKLNPRSLLKHERWFILAAFVLSVLLNPSPNVIDQIMLAGPMILAYNVGILIIYCMNRPRYSRKVDNLFNEDAKLQRERDDRLRDAEIVWQQATQLADHPVATLSAPVKAFEADILSATLTPDDELEDKLLKMEIEDDDTPPPTKVKVHQAAIRGGSLTDLAGKLKKSPKASKPEQKIDIKPAKKAKKPASLPAKLLFDRKTKKTESSIAAAEKHVEDLLAASTTPLHVKPPLPKVRPVIDIAPPVDTTPRVFPASVQVFKPGTAARVSDIVAPATKAVHAPLAPVTSAVPAAASTANRPRKYIDGFRSPAQRSHRISTI